jgi:site-specific recombinase XerC
MSWSDLRVHRSRSAAGELVVRFGVAVLDAYLAFLAVRSRPNTVAAVAYDLKVFFTVVGKPPRRVVAADVLGFVTAQYVGGPARRLRPAGEGGGVSARTVRRRLSSVSGLFAFLHARGDVAANPVPRGLPTRRERQRPRQGVPLVRTPRTLPRILEPGQVDALLAVLRTYRDRAMAEAMVLGGLRRCEVLGLRLADLQVPARRVFIVEGKGGHQRQVPVSGRFFASVAAYLDAERPPAAASDRLFVVLKGPRRGPAAVARRFGPDPRLCPGPGRPGPGDLPSVAAYLPDPAAGGRDGPGGGPSPGRARLHRVHPYLPAPRR